MPNFFRFFISVVPIFLGFALSGTLFFGHISHYVRIIHPFVSMCLSSPSVYLTPLYFSLSLSLQFVTVDMSAVTLFSLMFGDEVVEIVSHL